MKKIALIVPWFGPFRNDFYFWLKSVEYNPTVDFLFFTDQEIIAPPINLKVVKTNLKEIEDLARKNIWEGCVISKPYKICDYKVTYGELFSEYLKEYDFWGHCDVDLVFGDIRKFITDDILDRYDRLGVDGPLTIYRNTPEVNTVYRKAGDINQIFTEQHPFGFDEWGLKNNGTAPYWQTNLSDRLWCEKVFDNLAPYHYSFISGTVKKYNLGIKNLMFSFYKGHLYRYGTKEGKVDHHETLYVHIQKRPIEVKTDVSDCFSIIPPGNYVPFVENVTISYLKWHIRDSKFWAYYVRAMNKINGIIGLKPHSNMVLCPDEDM